MMDCAIMLFWAFVCLLFLKESDSILLCPLDDQRYNRKAKVLAIEDHAYGRIEPNTLEGVQGAIPNLQSLIIRNTSIVSIAPDTFYPFRTLNCLDLSRNKLNVLVGFLFRGLGSLKTLILSQNDIKYLGDSVFLHIKRLTSLDLSNNRLTEISDSAFRGLDQLEELHLEHNNLASVSPLTFEHIPTLKRLFIGHNPLYSIDLFAFKGLSLLYCSHTLISNFPALPPTVEELDFSRNKLTFIDHMVFRRFPILSKLWLSGNPWICDCSTKNFLNFALSTRILIDRDDMICAHPISADGLKIRNGLESLFCSDSTQAATVEIRETRQTEVFSENAQPSTVESKGSIRPHEPTYHLSLVLGHTKAETATSRSPFRPTGALSLVPATTDTPNNSTDVVTTGRTIVGSNEVELNAQLSDIQLKFPSENSAVGMIQNHSVPLVTLPTPPSSNLSITTITNARIYSANLPEVTKMTTTLAAKSLASKTILRSQSTTAIVPNQTHFPSEEERPLKSSSTVDDTTTRRTESPGSVSSFLNGQVSLKIVLLSLLFGLCSGFLIFLLFCIVKAVKKRRRNGFHKFFARSKSSPSSALCTVNPYCGDVIMRNSFGFRDNEYRSGNFALVSARHTLFPGLFASTFEERSGSVGESPVRGSPVSSITSATHLCPPESGRIPSVKEVSLKSVAFSEELEKTLEFCEGSSVALSSPSSSVISGSIQ